MSMIMAALTMKRDGVKREKLGRDLGGGVEELQRLICR